MFDAAIFRNHQGSPVNTIRVLMIEDNPDDVYLMRRLIGATTSTPRIVLETADTLSEGMARLEQGGIDAVLLDLSLPDSSGLATLIRLRERNLHVPVVVQTGLSDEDLGMEAVRQGAQDYLIKGEADIGLLVRALRYAIERHGIEEELRQHRSNLEALVAERTADLQRINEQLQQEIAERERAEKRAFELAIEQERARVLTNFVRAASHDFRTPLSTINTSLYLIRRLTDPIARDAHLEVLETQAARLARLVDGMLRLLQLESGAEFNLRPLKLNRLVQDVQLHVLSQASEKQVLVALDLVPDSPEIEADELELSYALRELVENAVTYSPQHGQVTIRTAAGPEHAVIEVEDHGPGISEDDLRYIFDPLYRADKARSANTGGPGLGLSIAKKIVEGHGGTIEVSSVVGQGSTFRVILPYAPR